MNATAQGFKIAEPYREPPHNVDAEQGLIGSLLLNNKVFDAVASIVHADDFFVEVHRRVFEVAATLITSGQTATPITLATYFGNQDLGGISLPVYLAKLRTESSMPMLAQGYAQAIHDLSIRRKLIAAAQEVAEQAYDLPVAVRPAQMAGEAIAAFHVIAGNEGGASHRREAHVSVAKSIGNIQAVQAGEVKLRRISTGFPDLDNVTEGYQPGTLWVVAARPGMGKTITAATSANKVAKAGNGVLLFSLEVPEEQMTARLMADLAYDRRQPIPFKNIMSGNVDPTAMWLLEDAYERFEKMPLVLDVSSRLTTAEIRVRVRTEKDRMAAKNVPLRVIFIDYLKQIQATDRYKGNRVYEVGEITYSLKQLAKDEAVCIVLLAQLNRALEGRDDKRPGLSDLRESGDLETDADVVAFVHRESYYIERSAEYRNGDSDAQKRLDETLNTAELILGKNRIGPTTTINLFCDVSCSTMSGIASADPRRRNS